MRKAFLLLSVSMLLPAGLLYGCGSGKEAVETGNIEEKEDSALSMEKELERLTRGDVCLDAEKLENYASGFALCYEDVSEQMVYSLEMPQIPQSDDAYLYLFAMECYEDVQTLAGEPAASGLKGTDCEICFPYEEEYLFEQFIPALQIDGKYVSLGEGIYLSNPEALADNKEEYPEPDSKKGLLLDPTMLGTEELTDLGVKHAIYNIPLSIIMGDTTDETFPTIVYTYKGKSYHFNGAAINGYDGLFTYLTSMDMCSTAIVLNDWNDNYIEMIHPDARNKDSGAFYYMFNTAEEEGVKELEAVACFLTERYSSGEYGIVHNWVVANEINQFKTWNYMDTEDAAYYAQEFEKAFRIFYQAAKSNYANSRVYFSIDHDWYSNQGDSKEYFNARDLVEVFQDAAIQHGNYDWGIAIHPYPDPLTRVNYWSQEYDKTQNAPILSIMNLGVLTDFLKQEKYLDRKGEVRSIMITELGFTSVSGERLQAAAFAYCYYIVEANPYIDAFIMNRQTDAPEELLQGLAFGIYEYDHTEKYLKDVFSYIDTEEASEYTDFMLNILGAESLEEALGWAK
ncbi:MAG: hypothetical protein J6K48_10310 [Lachnospiraceae bacterium]|nr:hypothetical protein [Lachnospiraceae bacterium]